MTSFSVDETSNQSCYSPVLGKRKLVKPPPSMYVNPLEDNVEGEGGSESSLMAASFTQENCRKMLARMVILDELSFKFVESEGFHQFCRALNPKFVIPSRVIVAKDCFHIDALKDLHVSIIRIRNAVKYVRSSPARLQIFKDFAKEDKMSTKNCLTMDVSTRWNSTFTMLDGAIKCQKTFERLEEHDPSTKIWTNKVEEAFRRLCDDYYMRMSKEKYSQTQSCTPIEGLGFQSQSEIPSISSSGSYKARATVHDRFKQSNKTCLDDAKTEVTRYMDEVRIDCIGDEYLDLLTWWKVNSSRFKIISQVVRDIYSIPISTVPSESAFSTGGRVLDSFRSSLTPQTVEALICAQNWIQSKSLDDMIEEIDGAEEIDEEFINIGKEMEAAFENLNNGSMSLEAQ
uniref:HAT C-terminal dimerisation domain-containing protein n=1 Tax=Cucumis melo TaxID=3656 RepID=A0A9I9EK68_CUCME